MITPEVVSELKEKLQSLTAYKDKELIRRTEWGIINFEQVQEEIDSLLFSATDLLDLPLEHLTKDVASQISGHIPKVAEQLERIDRFSIEGGNAGSNRDAICAELQGVSENFHASASLYITYLAYRRGDIAENITNLNKAVNDAKEILADAENWVVDKKDEVDDIVVATREAAASAGVATFTAEFDKEASELHTQSKKWLWTTSVLAVTTIGAAILFYFWPKVSLQADGWETLRNIVSKAAIIAVLFTGTIWCGRIYRALIHQATVNRHRALSLKTFQAFVKAADDPYVRDAVLMAATKTVFASVPTGFVTPDGNQDTGVNFVEFGKSPREKVAEAAADK